MLLRELQKSGHLLTQLFRTTFSFENITFPLLTGTRNSLSTQLNGIILQAFMLFMSLRD